MKCTLINQHKLLLSAFVRRNNKITLTCCFWCSNFEACSCRSLNGYRCLKHKELCI